MIADSASAPSDLIALARERSCNAASRWTETCRQLAIDDIVALYERLRASAPRRHSRGKRYFSPQSRSGITSSGSYSNREEEHLAIALWQHSLTGNGLQVHGLGSDLRIVDYQTPLKARQTDSRIGKIDLLGLIGDRLAVVELKAGAGSDSPLRALLEGLAYCAIVEANQTSLASELVEHGHKMDIAKPPCLIVGAPESYWARWKCGSGLNSDLSRLADSISKHLDVGVHFIAVSFGTLEKGLGGLPPRLTGAVRLHALRSPTLHLACDGARPSPSRF